MEESSKEGEDAFSGRASKKLQAQSQLSTKSKHGLWDSNQSGHIRGLSMGDRAS